jgi:DNA-binding CsgD family transcriptional regulator
MNQTSGLEDPTLRPKNSAHREQALNHGREAFRKGAWSTAVSELTAADSEAPLPPVELVELAQAGLLTGKDREAADALARAHQAFLEVDEIQPAARCAFWLGFTALLAGDVAQSSGWLSRASRLLEGLPKCVENGYLLLPVGYRAVHSAEPGKAIDVFAQAATIGQEFGDPDLTAMARQGQGRALIRAGKISDGVSLLDEAMISVTAGEVSPLTAGAVYCSVIEGCGEIFDLRRAQEWTSALERWCASQPDLVPYRGHCLVRRAEILQLHGKWQEALEEAQQVCDRFSQLNPKLEVAAAYYQMAEVYRLRGEFEAAEEAYRRAGSWREVARSGMALLRLAQGQITAASTAIRRIVEDVREPASRARILDCYVEICLAAGDIADARQAAGELLTIAGKIDAPFLHALSKRAKGAVLLTEKDPKPALVLLRESLGIWRDLNAPYEVARTRVLIANACDELDDRDSATLELELALEVFEQLSASPDCAVIEHLLQKRSKQRFGLLSSRELEVLKLVAAGRSNRAIAGTLDISEKTVARHISNIFNKLDLSSRAAATAYAYQNQLISST